MKKLSKVQKDGKQLSAWLSRDRGISIGIGEKDVEMIKPFLSIYPKNSGGYRVVLRKELLDTYNIETEVE